MDLKNAVAACLIALFASTLVVLIARSLDLQAASRLEPQLKEIVEELRAIRKQGGLAPAGAASARQQPEEDGLIVYYFHSSYRCRDCRLIESLAHETVETQFASELEQGKLAWKTANYETPAAAPLVKQFKIIMPVVVLAQMREGKVADWRKLDEVWGLKEDKPAYIEFVRGEIQQMLGAKEGQPAAAKPGPPAFPPPAVEPGDLPLPEFPPAPAAPEVAPGSSAPEISNPFRRS